MLKAEKLYFYMDLDYAIFTFQIFFGLRKLFSKSYTGTMAWKLSKLYRIIFFKFFFKLCALGINIPHVLRNRLQKFVFFLIQTGSRFFVLISIFVPLGLCMDHGYSYYRGCKIRKKIWKNFYSFSWNVYYLLNYIFY